MYHLCTQDGVVRMTPHSAWLGAGLYGLSEVNKSWSAAVLDLLVVLLLMGLAGHGWVAGLAGEMY